jgi:hypothetical protein
MGLRRTLTLAGAILAGLLTGCGAGDTSLVDSFYGAGTSPGSVYSESEKGRLVGVVFQRASDGRILILASGTASASQTPVPGVVFAIPAQNLSSTTNASGAYDIESVTPGDVTLTVTLPASLGGSTATFTVDVAPGATVGGIPALTGNVL